MSHEHPTILEADLVTQHAFPEHADPHIEAPAPTLLLHPSTLLEENVFSYKNRHFFFNLARTDDPGHIPLRIFPKGSDISYTTPRLNPTSISDDAKKRDHDLAALACRLAHATRPVDTAAHVLLHDHGTDDPQVKQVIYALDATRQQLAEIASDINHLRVQNLCKDKGLAIPQDNQNVLLTQEELESIRKQSEAAQRFNNSAPHLRMSM
ncbi:hypothetical protein BG000_010750 [Podila horticola]|nr:hypothetical protein BG000_010750 [Podila horticola]